MAHRKWLTRRLFGRKLRCASFVPHRFNVRAPIRNMNSHVFPLDNRTDVETFERLFLAYLGCQAMFPVQHISLTKAFDGLESNPDRGRLFAALVDITLTVGMVWIDTVAFGQQFNRLIAKTDDSDANISTGEGSFYTRMQMHYHANGYVLRYRSAWDKIMGFFVLLNAPEHYEQFVSAKSRKKAFRKIAEKSGVPPIEFVESVEKALTQFDDSFRTAEAHGTGILRKSSFVWTTFSDNPQAQFLGFWNVLNEVAHVIGGVFDESKRSTANK